MTEPYRVPRKNQIYRKILRGFFRTSFHFLGDVSIQGEEHIPPSGPYILAINHVSLLEIPFVGAFWPEFPEIIGAADVWRRPGQALFARLYHGIPVERGAYDRAALELVLDVLEQGYILLIAPEGTRSHTPGMQRAKPGIAFIADKAQVPIVPLGVVGTTEDFLKKGFTFQNPPLELRVGEPFHLPPIEGRGSERREARQANADRVMAHIAAVLPPEYRGEYENFKEYLSGRMRANS